jgi:hypothetical protein
MSPSTLTLPIVKLDTSHAQGRLIIGPDGHSLYQYATHDQRKGAHATYHLRRISPGGGYVNVAAFEAKSVTLPGRFRSVAYKHLFAHRPLIGLCVAAARRMAHISADSQTYSISRCRWQGVQVLAGHFWR